MENLMQLVAVVDDRSMAQRVLDLVENDMRFGHMPLYVAIDRTGAPLGVCGDLEVLIVANGNEAVAYSKFEKNN